MQKLSHFRISTTNIMDIILILNYEFTHLFVILTCMQQIDKENNTQTFSKARDILCPNAGKSLASGMGFLSPFSDELTNLFLSATPIRWS